jgi:amino acid transporter
MITKIKDILIGPPLPTRQLGDVRLNKIRALAAFSPGLLSSIAYANQEIYLGLVVAGSIGLSLSFPIGLAIVALLAVVTISYFQTIHGYPTGGGSYTVARENLGTKVGLVAAAALLIDYSLTAAVSLTAGVSAIASAFPGLWSYRILIALFLLTIITLINLRGIQETGTLMSIPVYLFLFTYIPMLVYGLIRLRIQGPVSLQAVAPAPVQPLTLILVVHAFSTGCTALTGIEAISNGVQTFKPPESKNAGRTLTVMALLMGFLFLGSIGLTQAMAVVAGPEETILSALARTILGRGPAYLIIQATILLILTVAANTSFAGFPQMAAILAKDNFLPRQLTGLGDRLVFVNGIIALSTATGLLIVLFGGDPHALVPLFAIGAFLAFTLSQTGMVVHWWREHGQHWWLKAAANGLGALATGVTVLVIGISKFLGGAWISILLIPILVILFARIRGHYREVSKQLSLRGLPPSLKTSPPLRIVVPISGVHRGTIDAVAFAQSLCSHVVGVYVEMEPGAGEHVKAEWMRWWPEVPLEIVPSPYRSIIGPLLDFLDRIDSETIGGQPAAVLLPEFVPAKWWQALLHNQTAWLLKAALLYRRRQLGGHRRVIIDVPYYLRS